VTAVCTATFQAGVTSNLLMMPTAIAATRAIESRRALSYGVAIFLPSPLPLPARGPVTCEELTRTVARAGRLASLNEQEQSQ
jgi:hypothetical protein